MKCRAMQALHLLALEPIAETTGDPNSYGFRPERSTADAVAQCFGVLSRKANAEWVLEGDIQGCFDNISHDWLIANIPMDKAILQKWLRAGYVYQKQLFPSHAGTPQGGIISPGLANMTLDGLEAMLAKRFPNAKWTARKCAWCVMQMISSSLVVRKNGWRMKSGPPWLNFWQSVDLSSLRKNQDNAHRGRVRLPRMEPAQVQRQAPDQAVQGEHRGSTCQAARVDQDQQNDTTG